MKNLLIYLLLLSSSTIYAQSMEIGATLGGMTYKGDISPSAKIYKLNKIHPTVGAMFRYNLNDFLAFRLNLAHGTISGDDALADTPKRRARNIHFRTNIQDVAAMMEINLLRYNPLEGRNFTIYAMGGIGAFYFNPQALYQGEWIDLQPLGTEGQFLDGNTSSYRRLDLSVPAGGGVKYALSGRLTIGLEVLGRLTFTDYLDDVSANYPNQGELIEQMGIISANLSNRKDELPHNDPNPVDGRVRGNVDNNDHFFSGSVTLTYRIINSRGSRQKMRQSRNLCPSF